MDTLDTHLRRLDAWLAALPNAPSWIGHAIAEGAYEASEVTGRFALVAATPLAPVADYAPRFDELLRAGYAWINLHGAGVIDGRLVVTVEIPLAPTGVPDGRTSVNFSGPIQAVQSRPGWPLDLRPAGPAQPETAAPAT